MSVPNVAKERDWRADDWVRTASAGDEVIYWHGQHCAGPHRQSIMAFAEAGLVILFQKRDTGGDGLFNYHARRSSKK